MAIELWLNFKEENGESRRVLVDVDNFVIGRTPDNDLQIANGKLSRRHAQIQRFADVFVVSDCGSSNGSTLNDQKIDDPVGLKNGDRLTLGDAVEVEIELVSDQSKNNDSAGNGGGPAPDDTNDEEKNRSLSSDSSANGAAASSESSNGGIPFGFFILAPALGVFVLLVIIGIVLLVGGPKKSDEIIRDRDTYTKDTIDDDENGGTDSGSNPENKTLGTAETPTISPSDSPNTESTIIENPTPATVTPDPTEEIVTTPQVASDAEKLYPTSASFLRRIAQNDPKAFLTDTQMSIINSKIGRFKGSAALAENIRNAKKNAAQITEIANSKNLKPQFLANAVLAKLGDQRGDIVANARDMAEDLSKISKPFGNESADECLLVVAAYSNNTSGESLQTIAGVFTKNFPTASPRTIRSIWFFKENGKLTGDQFDFALKYLAIGTITQNPKAFNVQAEALLL